MLDAYIEKMLKAAKKAAQKAHDECVPNPVAFQVADSLFGEFDENKPYEVCKEGNCGGAYLKVAGPGKNMISKELKAKGLIDTLGSSYGWDMSVDVGRRGSQSADRMEAAAIAYGNVLKKYGVPNRVKTYLT
jgi:hypothetical protein|tara:strand:+ start:106 stop:501 length:396 start_codon:yes stop_codon:yes gene_type:complete